MSQVDEKMTHIDELVAPEVPNDPDESRSMDEVLGLSDLIIAIFKFLDVLDRSRVSRTCRSWNQASTAEEFWTQLSLVEHPMTLRQARQWKPHASWPSRSMRATHAPPCSPVMPCLVYFETPPWPTP